MEALVEEREVLAQQLEAAAAAIDASIGENEHSLHEIVEQVVAAHEGLDAMAVLSAVWQLVAERRVQLQPGFRIRRAVPAV